MFAYACVYTAQLRAVYGFTHGANNIWIKIICISDRNREASINILFIESCIQLMGYQEDNMHAVVNASSMHVRRDVDPFKETYSQCEYIRT